MGVSKEDAKSISETVIREIAKLLESGDKIRFEGLGTFKTVSFAKRERFMPWTCEYEDFPAYKSIKFSPTKHLKQRIKGGS